MIVSRSKATRVNKTIYLKLAIDRVTITDPYIFFIEMGKTRPSTLILKNARIIWGAYLRGNHFTSLYVFLFVIASSLIPYLYLIYDQDKQIM